MGTIFKKIRPNYMINPTLLHIYGSFGIKWYGVWIVSGILLTLFLVQKDKVMQKFMRPQQLENLITFFIITAVVGARILFLWEAEQPLFSQEAIKLWSGGFSVQGSILACLIFGPLYLWYNNIPILHFLDRAFIYIPLMQSMGRLGCFFAGCCCGNITNLPWHVIYTHPESLAPLNVPLHPTQLYSSALLFILFCFLYTKKDILYRYQGALLSCYLAGVGLERFIVDFLRNDRGILYYYLSLQQWISLGIVLSSYIVFLGIKMYRKKL